VVYQRRAAGGNGGKAALPAKFTAPDFDAAGTDVAIEELTLAYERLERDDPPP